MGWSFTHTLKHKHAQVSREQFPQAGSLMASIPVVDSLTCSKYCRVSTTWSRKMPPKCFLSFSEVARSLVASWSSSTWKRMWKPWVLYNKKKGRKHKTTKDNIKHQLLSKTKLRSLELGKLGLSNNPKGISVIGHQKGGMGPGNPSEQEPTSHQWPAWPAPHPSPWNLLLRQTLVLSASRNFVLSQQLYRPITWHLTALSGALENADWINSL